MISPKRNLFSKPPKQKSLKDINTAYYLRCIKKQLFSKHPPSITKTPKKTKTPSSHRFPNFSSSSSKTPKQFINIHSNIKPISSIHSSIKTANTKPNAIINDSNEANSLNDYIEHHLKLKSNKTIEYESNILPKRTKHISYTPSSTPITKKIRSKSKKDVLDYVKGYSFTTRNNVSSNHNNSKVSIKSNNYVMGLNDEFKSIQSYGKRHFPKSNYSSNDINCYCISNEEMDYDNYCKILRHKVAVLKFQVDKIRNEKLKLQEILKRNYEDKEVISKLQNEIQSYNNVAINYKKNCNELTKEIISLQNQIKLYK